MSQWDRNSRSTRPFLLSEDQNCTGVPNQKEEDLIEDVGQEFLGVNFDKKASWCKQIQNVKNSKFSVRGSVSDTWFQLIEGIFMSILIEPVNSEWSEAHFFERERFPTGLFFERSLSVISWTKARNPLRFPYPNVYLSTSSKSKVVSLGLILGSLSW